MSRRAEGWKLYLDSRTGIYSVRWRHLSIRYHRSTGMRDVREASDEAARIYVEAVGGVLRRSPHRDGAIYFVRADGDGPIKIGFAGNLAARMASMRTDSPVPLSVLGSHAGSLADEKALHRRFAPHRVRGEWFRPVAEILEYVEQHARD